ncbi:ABC transporter ATP-binding protein [Demequina sp. TTPB684]|uniref:ABC transporter ATP-binding protein n=1 Tax=unclassified Demequina TaxID=2620311 RepID=UPI001CF11026|nr:MULTISPECIES: ABC transporter ATP-binding protein [unclassified Demequina]MCB2413632.1 ABC transporter ATP-binding protein [Demequina sp. TTPB684]UPU88245.1 ABC transporter ATP-binding protein [Demequina sp. TMPB413]
MTSGLRVEGLTVRYGGADPRVAVDAASFGIEPGGSLALVGASGSGKSSLLLAIAGVIESTGSVSWDGHELAGVPPHRRGFGLVFQDGQLFPHMSVGANIGFGLEMQGVERREREARVGELLEMVGLEGAEHRAVTELSGGERQRVALARTLAPRPRLVLLDEPLSSLDADLRERLARDVRELLEAQGTTWIVVTHDRAEAEAMADRQITMSAGRLAEADASD